MFQLVVSAATIRFSRDLYTVKPPAESKFFMNLLERGGVEAGTTDLINEPTGTGGLRCRTRI